MKKTQFVPSVLFVSLLFVIFSATARAALWDVPVAPGETFRWVFVTSLTIDAHSSDIATYNNLVNAAADAAGTTITGVLGKSTIATIADIEWKAIASTPYTDAIDNIGVSSAPIYTPLGDMVADNTLDLFDGEIKTPINMSEFGAPPPSLPPSYTKAVWTGSTTEGLREDPFSLGGRYPDDTPTLGAYYGSTWSKLDAWIHTSLQVKPEELHLYAISEELSVVPVPSALILGATGLLSSTLGLIRLRRKHQE